MYLKRLEAFGFKSFADKIQLEFEPGITGVVGPNGCGKSNLVDAIKWTLGEQSAKSLRSSQMEDVIFNGSQNHSPMALAEVSLTFDNSRNVLPIDYSELTVTRRLFRSGESEYLLNKTQCRLKDVRDLFLDTGIGTDSYAIMEQGKVEFILQSKAEERRSLFEEASGVAKYRARKEEALRKLEKVNFDLIRLNDALEMLKEQIKNLDSAARKAKQYQKHQEELKNLEIFSISRQVTVKEEEINVLGKENQDVSENLQSLTTIIDKIETDLAGLRLELNTQEEEVVQAQVLTLNLQNNLSRSEDNIHTAENKIKESDVQNNVLKEEINQAEKEIVSLKESIASVNLQLEELTKTTKLLEVQIQEKEKLFAGLEDKNKELTSKIANSNSVIFNLAQEETELRNEIIRSRTKFENFNNQKSRLEKELAGLSDKLNNINNILGEKARMLLVHDEETKKIQDYEKELRENIRISKEKEQELYQVLDKQRQTLTENSTRLESIKQWEENESNASHNFIKQLPKDLLPGISGPIADLIDVNQESEKIVEMSFGNKLNYLISETEQQAHNAIRYLKENKLGWAVFVVRNKIDERALKGNNVMGLIKYPHEMEKILKFLLTDTYVAEGNVYSSAIVQGGNFPAAASYFSQKQEKTRIEQEIENLQLQVAESQKQKEILSRGTNSLEEELSQKLLIIQEREVAKASLIAETDNLDKEKNLLAEEIAVVQKELVQMEECLTQETNLINEKENVLKQKEEQEKKLRDDISVFEGEYKQHEEEWKGLNNKLNEEKIVFSTTTEKLESRKSEKDNKEKEEQRLGKFLQNSQQELVLLAQEKVQAEETLKKEKENIANSETNKMSAEKVLSGIRDRIQVLKDNINQEDTALREKRLEFSGIQNISREKETKLNQSNIQKKYLLDRLHENYNMTIEQIPEYLKHINISEEENSVSSQIEKIKKKLEGFGPVNLAAPEEYEQLQARLQFNLSQQEDLDKARKDLHQLITKINITTQQRFQETFGIVRENFKQIFNVLFEGGEADLILTNEDDILETGIDILAQPPGKKLQSLFLLSGGERALVAIALLFAFYLVKPAPFCMLDEVDAPLDEANIHRFLHLIKDFTSRSQFIIVTHNKKTMEIADTLYGVTMEEFGISKMISLKLRKLSGETTATVQG